MTQLYKTGWFLSTSGSAAGTKGALCRGQACPATVLSCVAHRPGTAAILVSQPGFQACVWQHRLCLDSIPPNNRSVAAEPSSHHRGLQYVQGADGRPGALSLPRAGTIHRHHVTKVLFPPGIVQEGLVTGPFRLLTSSDCADGKTLKGLSPREGSLWGSCSPSVLSAQ